jgi:predicted component of type VI protein secretion system
MHLRTILIAILFALTQISGPGISMQRTAGPKPRAVQILTIRTDPEVNDDDEQIPAPVIPLPCSR